MRRGEVWWAELPAPAGARPVVLLSRNEAYSIRDLVTVAPVTTRIRKIPTEVSLGTQDGMPKACVINLDTVTTIPKRLLSRRITVLGPAKLLAVDNAILFSLGIDDR
jgi:mRNA interferase MazF